MRPKRPSAGPSSRAQLLAFSRTQRLAVKPTDVNAVIEGMKDLLTQSLGPSVQVQLQLDPTIGLAMADDNQIELAVLNLAINARDAMESAGSVTISTGHVTLPDEDNGLPAGAYITLDVADDGTGMEPEVIARAFDPFFTTKPPGQGTGLGLAQVYGVARQCGGDARIRSEIGKGSSVTLWLRSASEVAVPGDYAHAAEIASAGAGKVLLIDDDPDVRETMRELLTEMGYDVQTADSGKAGLAMLEEAQPDLIIIDFAMPEMNGAEVAEAVHASWPALPILFVSGHADTLALEKAVGVAPFLRKPFRPADLAAAMREALGLAPHPNSRAATPAAMHDGPVLLGKFPSRLLSTGLLFHYRWTLFRHSFCDSPP